MNFYVYVCFFKQKTAYEMLISDWSSDVFSSELQALKVTQLSDNQHFSWLPGMVNKPPQGFFGAWTDALNLGGREFRDRDNLTMLAASRLKDKQDRLTRELMSKTVSETMGDIMTRIAAPRAGQSRVMLNHFFSQRQGWDLAEELTEEGIKTGKPKLIPSSVN